MEYENVYNTQFMCTYQFHNKDLAYVNPFSRRYIDEQTKKGEKIEFDESEESQVLGNMIYKQEVMYAFFMDVFSADELQKKINAVELVVKEKMRNNEALKRKLETLCFDLSTSIMSQDSAMGFSLLFAYDYFHIMHLCILDILRDGDIGEENWIALKYSIK